MAGKGFNPDESPPPFDPNQAPPSFNPDDTPPSLGSEVASRARAFAEGVIPYSPEIMAAADTGIDKLTGGNSSYADNVASRWKQYQQDRQAHPNYGLAGDLAGAYKLTGPAIGKVLSPFTQALSGAGKTGTVINTALGLAGYNAARDPGPRDPSEGVLQGQKRLDNATGGFTDPYQVVPALAFGALGHHFMNQDAAGGHADAAEARANDAALENAGAKAKNYELALESPDAKDITQRMGNEARQLMRQSGKLLPNASDIHEQANSRIEDVGKGIGQLTDKAKESETTVDVNKLFQNQSNMLPTPEEQDFNGAWGKAYDRLKGYFGRLGSRGETVRGPYGEVTGSNANVGDLQGIRDDLRGSIDFGRLRSDMPEEEKSLASAYGSATRAQNDMVERAHGGVDGNFVGPVPQNEGSGIRDLNQQYHDLQRLKEMARWASAQDMASSPAPKGVPLTKGQLPWWVSNTSKGMIMQHWPAARVRANEAIQKVFTAAPELAAKYTPMINQAFQKSPALGSAYIYNLLSRPDIRDHLDEQPDRSRDKVVSHEDAKDAFLEGTGGRPPDQDE